MEFEGGHYFINFYHMIIQSSWMKEILISSIGGIIGGLIGGLLLYKCYVIPKEKIKDLNNTKSICTKMLLTTQTVLIFQMQELHGFKTIFSANLNFKIDNKKTIGELLKEIKLSSDGVPLLKNIKNQEMVLIELSKHIALTPAYSHIVPIPYEIFSMSEFSLKLVSNVSELTRYFDGVSKSNRKYLEILGLLERHQEVRDSVMMSSQSSIEDKLCIVAARVILMNILMQETDNLLIRMNKIFDQSAQYINALGVSKPISADRDKDGKLIFEFAKWS